MTAPTTAARAARARRLRLTSPAETDRAVTDRAVTDLRTVRDPCPTCGAELGQPHGASRRVAVLTGVRGVFSWRCPQCRAAWTERASTRSGSTTRSSDLPG